MAWRRRDRRSPVMSDMSLASSAFGVTIARSALSIDRLSQSCSVFMAERWPASREAPRFLAEARHLGSLDGRPNRRGSADPITHRCRELAGGSARLRSARVVPFPSVDTVPLVQTIAGITLSAHTQLCVTRGCVKMFLVERNAGAGSAPRPIPARDSFCDRRLLLVRNPLGLLGQSNIQEPEQFPERAGRRRVISVDPGLFPPARSGVKGPRPPVPLRGGVPRARAFVKAVGD